MEPLVFNWKNNEELIFEEGMVFTVEPVLMLNEHKEIYMWED